jgi:hypothetical protein
MLQAGRDLLYDICRHGDVSETRLAAFKRTLQASCLRDDPYLKKIAKRATRLPELKGQVEELPDCLDAAGVRLVDAQSATSEWLGYQVEVFEERFERILQVRRPSTSP